MTEFNPKLLVYYIKTVLDCHGFAAGRSCVCVLCVCVLCVCGVCMVCVCGVCVCGMCVVCGSGSVGDCECVCVCVDTDGPSAPWGLSVDC